MSAVPLLSVVVVSWNTRELLLACLASVEAHLGAVAHELIVVDNASSDGSAEAVAREFPAATLLRQPTNLGFGRGCNAGMAAARGRFLLLLNSDARLPDDGLLRLVARLEERPDVGLIGPRLVHADGRLQPSAQRFGSLALLCLEELGLYKLLGRERRAALLLGGYWSHDAEREADWLVGACLLLRREVFEQTGGFDPGMFLYGEEVEWCRRIRQRGFGVLFCPRAEVRHVGHASALQLVGERGRFDLCLLAADRLTERWQGRWAAAGAGLVRCAGALLKLPFFALKRLVRREPRDREALATARAVLSHYARRWLGRLDRAP